jgi:hypothetical protein
VPTTSSDEMTLQKSLLANFTDEDLGPVQLNNFSSELTSSKMEESFSACQEENNPTHNITGKFEGLDFVQKLLQKSLIIKIVFESS